VRALVAVQITACLSGLRELKELFACEGPAFSHLFVSTTPLLHPTTPLTVSVPSPYIIVT